MAKLFKAFQLFKPFKTSNALGVESTPILQLFVGTDNKLLSGTDNKLIKGV